jgi:hypothetical protein
MEKKNKMREKEQKMKVKNDNLHFNSSIFFNANDNFT